MCKPLDYEAEYTRLLVCQLVALREQRRRQERKENEAFWSFVLREYGVDEERRLAGEPR